MLTLNDLHRQNLILLEAVSGSRAYGLATPESDTDIKGVFYLPRSLYYGLGYIPQISNETNDIVYYELGRFVELLLQSNPNTLELLASPTDCVRHRSPLMDAFKPAWFVSQACRQSFAGYALGQIKKARGLNKKIVNPMPSEKKTVLDFCHIVQGAGTVALQTWLDANGLTQRHAGLVNVPHARNLFALFYDADGSRGYHGIMQKNSANNLALSSIPAGEKPLAYLSFNQDGYSSYCREYASYQTWQAERNETRYRNTAAHGQGYDAKNMMHTFRLLETARDIAQYGEIRVRRDNRDELLAIKNGAFGYDALLARAEALMAEIEALFDQNPCGLPEQPDRMQAETALVSVRGQLYGV
ncbi:DNA polymerase beta superfamily protein [Neisseria sp.]|uniref:nucleotidyltransferase domain-containing protein n=1 Tax=Neisseria sp. TaxID=192066 RepID=UPI0035A0554E